VSDEFLRVAKKEINDDISEIGILLQSCSDDDTLCKKAAHFGKYFHKIKGLAPMMGGDHVGYVAALMDNLLKTAVAGDSVKGIYLAIKKSHEFMQNALNGDAQDLDLLKAEIEKIINTSKL